MLLICMTVSSCASPAERYAKDFVRWDAQSDAANTASDRCGENAVLIEGRSGLSPHDYRCAFPAEFVLADIADPTQVRDRIADFDRDLRDSGNLGHVRSCRMIVDVTQGMANSNHSYGAICMVESAGQPPREYLLCNDKMVGHFALTSSFAVDHGWVADFVKSRCVGG